MRRGRHDADRDRRTATASAPTLDEYRLQSRGGFGIINIQTSDRNGKVVGVAYVHGDDELMLISQQGKILRMVAERHPRHRPRDAGGAADRDGGGRPGRVGRAPGGERGRRGRGEWGGCGERERTSSGGAENPNDENSNDDGDPKLEE